jgi:hypothetical protein
MILGAFLLQVNSNLTMEQKFMWYVKIEIFTRVIMKNGVF